jgi:hypothetical protein
MMFATKTLVATAIDIIMLPDVLAEIKKDTGRERKDLDTLVLCQRTLSNQEIS